MPGAVPAATHDASSGAAREHFAGLARGGLWAHRRPGTKHLPTRVLDGFRSGLESCVRRAWASTSGPTRTPACRGQPRTTGGLPRPQATCVPDLSPQAECRHGPGCPRSRAPRQPCSRLNAPSHPRTAVLERSPAREYGLSHTAGMPRRRLARGSNFTTASQLRCVCKPCGRAPVRAHGCPCEHVLIWPCTDSARRHTAHDQHSPRSVRSMRLTAGAPHCRRATPPARDTACAPHRPRVCVLRCLRWVSPPACKFSPRHPSARAPAHDTPTTSCWGVAKAHRARTARYVRFPSMRLSCCFFHAHRGTSPPPPLSQLPPPHFLPPF